MGRIAVLREMRGLGLGKLLLRSAEAWAEHAIRTDCDGACVISFQLSSQVVARGFYEAQGYEGHGGEYLEQGQPHIMYRKSVVL